MNNPLKIVVGTVLGAGVGAGISTALQRTQPEAAGGTAIPAADTSHSPIESLRARWERAKLAGEAAKAAREAEMIAYFRYKVRDPEALAHHPDLGDGAEPHHAPKILRPGQELPPDDGMTIESTKPRS